MPKEKKPSKAVSPRFTRAERKRAGEMYEHVRPFNTELRGGWTPGWRSACVDSEIRQLWCFLARHYRPAPPSKRRKAGAR